MRISLHPKVASDVEVATEYYRTAAGPELAAEFYREFRQLVVRAADQPGAFAVREHDLRRANLPRFPYHFLFRVKADVLRVLVVRHHRRHPDYGVRRR